MKHQITVHLIGKREKMAKFKVVEIFTSINGEGMRAGELATFVRFLGCNLNCTYCDTMWANDENAEYTWMTEEDIYQKIQSTGIKNVTLTGGEPLYQNNIDTLLCRLIKDKWLRIEIETNGSIPLINFIEYKDRIVFTMDYKLDGSGMEAAMNYENFKHLNKLDTVKFVVSDSKDLIRAKDIIEQYSLIEKCHVMISPVFGKIQLNDIVEFMKINKLNDIKMQIQMHKVIWNPNKRGV